MSDTFSGESILLFDGECNLCNGFVQFVIKRDPKGKIKFTSLQSETGKKLMQQYHIPSGYMASLIFYENGKVFFKSTAVLRLSGKLRGLWPLCYYIFILVPRVIRDYIYDWIARNRICWFGKAKTCWVMKEEYKNRFL